MANLKFDSAVFNIISSSFENISREMAIALERSSWSSILNCARDFSTTVIDKDFNLIAVPEEILPGQAVTMQRIVKSMAEFFRKRGEKIDDGDTLLSNLALLGNLHNPEICLASPVFYEGELVFWTGARGHLGDIGTPSPSGGLYPYAKDIYSEGLKIPPVKVYAKGEQRMDIVEMYLWNLRFREISHGDLMAHIAATWVGRERLIALIDKYGKDTVHFYKDKLLDYTDRMVGEEIRRMKPGTYYGEDWLDTNSYGTKDIPVKCKLIVKDDRWIVDLSETPDQMIGPCNCSLGGCTEGAVASSLGYVIDPRIPKNEGLCRHYEIICPKGNMLNAEYPASCQLATVGAMEGVYRALLRACSVPVGDHGLAAPCHARYNAYGVMDYREGEQRPCGFLEANSGGGGGATYGFDGSPCMHDIEVVGGMKFISIEVLEQLYPMLILKTEIETDTMGAGKWRGAPGIDWRVVFYECSPVEITTPPMGQNNVPFGTMGGKPGKGSVNYDYHPKEPNRRRFHSASAIFFVPPGRIHATVSSGGGGYGDPLEREPEVVREDVRNEFISPGAAREDYGVVLDPESLEVDTEATEGLRDTMRKSRRELPVISPTKPNQATLLKTMMTRKDEYIDHDKSPTEA